MSTSFAVVALFLSLVMFEYLMEARKDNGEYWQGVGIKDEKKSNCDTNHINQKKLFLKDFEPRPNLSSYDDDSLFILDDKKFVMDIKQGPTVLAYTDDVGLAEENRGMKEEKILFVKDFEPRHDASVYEG